MKTNYNFAKLKGRVPIFAQSPLRVSTHHHEEYDVPVLDPETGEPTGETEHVVRDWDTWETKTFPTAADFLRMGWPPVIDKAPKALAGSSRRESGPRREVMCATLRTTAQTTLSAPL